ncbi:MAG: hypothetical protein U0169_10375 [Polyangiaceae bacterium]
MTFVTASPVVRASRPTRSIGIGFVLALLAGCSGASEDHAALGALNTGGPAGSSALTAPSIFPATRSGGSITVTLRPTEVVQANQDKLVTFGVPFPRGWVTDPAQIRVLRNGQEIPAYVGVASPWRNALKADVDGASIRVARIQIHHTFANSAANGEQIEVQWGTARTQNVTTLTPVRQGWHTADSGTFVAADAVQEPDVYAVLPKNWLTQSGVSLPSRALDDSVPEARENPTTTKGQSFTGFLGLDHAANNFFYTTINQDDARVTADNQNKYKSFYESWLYDRSGTFFQGYIRSGYLTQLREAVRAADFYKKHIYRPGGAGQKAAVTGMFDMKVDKSEDYPGGNGAMYSYAEPFAYTYWMTGDDSMLEYLPWICQAQDQSEPTRWSPSLGSWTERHTSYTLLDNVIAYEVTGEAKYKTKMMSIVDDFVWHQDGAGGQLPANRIDGGLWHTSDQHGDGEGMVASPWMSALIVNAMARAYMVTEDPRVARFIARMGTFEKAATKMRQPADVTYEVNVPVRSPDYITTITGASSESAMEDVEHSLDVANALAWAGYFADLTGTPDPTLRQTAQELYTTYMIGVDYYTRPAAPASGLSAFRVDPDRKYGWQYHSTGTFGWLMNPPASVDPGGNTGGGTAGTAGGGTAGTAGGGSTGGGTAGTAGGGATGGGATGGGTAGGGSTGGGTAGGGSTGGGTAGGGSTGGGSTGGGSTGGGSTGGGSTGGGSTGGGSTGGGTVGGGGSASGIPSGNLFEGSNFDNATDMGKWSSVGGATLTLAKDTVSSSSLRVSTKSAGQGVAQVVRFASPIPAGVSVAGEIWVKRISGADRAALIQMIVHHADGSPDVTMNRAVSGYTTAQGWTRGRRSFVTAHPVSSVEFRVLNNVDRIQTFAVDSALFTAN